MINKYDLARLDGFTGTAVEFYAPIYEEAGLTGARAAGFNGHESELQKFIADRDSSLNAKLEAEQKALDLHNAIAKKLQLDADFVQKITGNDGLDAFEVAKAAGFEGERDDWLASLTGADGASAYELALLSGFDGSESEWLAKMVGEQGLSAYDLWLSVGNNGSLADFLASLKGEKGDKGDQGEQGIQGEKGDKGDIGEMPRHQWDGTRIRFEQSDGRWGQWVDVRGATGAPGSGGGAGSLSLHRFYDGFGEFPVPGKEQILYFDTSTDPYSVYVWADGAYQSIGGGEGSGTAYTVAVQGKNKTGATIPKGTAVMATGTLGASGIITIAPMDGTNAANAKYMIGVAGEDILPDAEGDVVDIGKVRGFDTTMWAEGDVLWVSPTTPGALTNVEPTIGQIQMPVAFVVTDHANNGEIMVRVTPIDEGAFAKQAFETVAKNLRSADVVLAYEAGELTTLTYADGIVKTLNYTAGDLTSVVLSGATPAGIDLTKTLTYTAGELTAVAYS